MNEVNEMIKTTMKLKRISSLRLSQFMGVRTNTISHWLNFRELETEKTEKIIAALMEIERQDAEELKTYMENRK